VWAVRAFQKEAADKTGSVSWRWTRNLGGCSLSLVESGCAVTAAEFIATRVRCKCGTSMSRSPTPPTGWWSFLASSCLASR
jgi:hypothetical protein